MTEDTRPETGAFGYADLFAGVGGFAAVLRAMGGMHRYAVEIDTAAAAVYEANWGYDPQGDITADANDERMLIPPHDIIAGGFPCQPFSKSGAQRGMDEVRGTLFFNIEKAIRAHLPTLVVLENVRNLAGPRHKHEWQVIIEHLREIGYCVSDTPAIFSPDQIAPEFGGSPQRRERVFITATLIPDTMPSDPSPAQLTLPDRVLMRREWDLKEDLPLDSTTDVPGSALSADEVAWIEHWELMVQFMREWRRWQATSIGEAQRRLPGFPIWTDAWVATKKARDGLLEGAPAWKADFLRKNFDLFDALRGVDAKWVKGWLREVRKFPESRRKLEWQAQDTQSLWGCVISFRPSGLRAKRMTHLPALVAITQTPVLGPLRRKLSAREAARLQGLPNGYSFEGQTDKATFKQMGNGVNTGVVWNVLKAHCARDRHLLIETPQGRAILEAVDGSPDNPREVLGGLFAYSTPAPDAATVTI